MRIFAALLMFLVAMPLSAQEAVTLYWEDLLPVNEEAVRERLADSKQVVEPQDSGAAGDNSFLIVSALDGHRVKLPGFIVPLEFSADGKLSDFLFVPYQGACIHEPPPPPNQVVHAKSPKPQEFPNLWTPVWLTGIMSTEQYLNYLGDAAYTMEIESWKLYTGPE